MIFDTIPNDEVLDMKVGKGLNGNELIHGYVTVIKNAGKVAPLNEVVANLNNGVVDSKFIVPWENFKNTLLVTNTDGLNKISTRIFKIIEID